MSTPAYAQGAQLALLKLGMFHEPEVPAVTTPEAKRVGEKLHVDFKKYPLEGFREGIHSEFEHTKDPVQAGKISLDHLKESPRYYTELKKMEDRLKREG
jgi:hypothetical protein